MEDVRQRVQSHKTGFTLIELLVVIGIIGILSSIVLVSVNDARKKARDARVISDFREIRTALALYYSKYGKYPDYIKGGNSREKDFEYMADILVKEKLLSKVPSSPSKFAYRYYNYGLTIPTSATMKIGAILVAELETGPSTDTGISPSCRPWNAGANWCSKTPSRFYCICNPY